MKSLLMLECINLIKFVQEKGHYRYIQMTNNKTCLNNKLFGFNKPSLATEGDLESLNM